MLERRERSVFVFFIILLVERLRRRRRRPTATDPELRRRRATRRVGRSSRGSPRTSPTPTTPTPSSTASAQRNIPVGVVVLDSPWETHYNTFVPNPTRYHDFDKLLADLHGAEHPPRPVDHRRWSTATAWTSRPAATPTPATSPNFEQGLVVQVLRRRGHHLRLVEGHRRRCRLLQPARGAVVAPPAGCAPRPRHRRLEARLRRQLRLVDGPGRHRRRDRSRTRTTPRPTTTTFWPTASRGAAPIS